MPSTTEQNPPVDFNLSLLDPSSWEEPKELIPVKVVQCGLRWSDEKYNAATEFRAALPKPIQQLVLNVERLDAIYFHEDGSHFFGTDGKDLGETIPVPMYAGVDLQKMDKKGVIKNIMKTRGKEQFVVTGWVKVVGALVPNPERLIGMMLTVERYREKEIASGFFAKNVIIPVEILSPTYQFTGTVQRFKASERGASDGAIASAANAGLTNTAGISKEMAAGQIRAFLNSLPEGSEIDVTTLGHPNFPAQARIEPFTSAFANDTVEETLTQFGA